MARLISAMRLIVMFGFVLSLGGAAAQLAPAPALELHSVTGAVTIADGAKLEGACVFALPVGRSATAGSLAGC